MKWYKALLLFSLIICSLPSHGAEQHVPEKDSIITMAWDEAKVDLRLPTVEEIDRYRQDPEYKYDFVKEPESWWSRLLRWILSKISLSEGSWSVLGWTLIAIAAIALIFLILKILGVPVKGLFIFSRSTKVTNLSFSAAQMNIDDQHLEKKLHAFIDAEAYREATRILFILLLKQLNTMKLIKWSTWKTDREYYYELQDQQLKSTFLQLIRNYEYIWFGQFSLGKEQFQTVQLQFEDFTNHLVKQNSRH